MSFFAPWRAIDDAPANLSSSSNQQSSPGPITAPGGWSTLLTWRPQKAGPVLSESPSNESFIDTNTATSRPSQTNAFNDKYYTTRSSPKPKTNKTKHTYDPTEDVEIDANESKNVAFTARTRQKGAEGVGGGGGVTRMRAPIPFELDQTVLSRSKARSGTFSSTTSSIASKDQSMTSWPLFTSSDDKLDSFTDHAKSRSNLKLTSSAKGMDSADVSAELTTKRNSTEDEDLENMSNLEGAIGDISLEAGALDSAFQTLTRIQAKDTAATVKGSNRISSSSSINPISSPDRTTLTHSPISQQKRQSLNNQQTRKMSIGGWYTPNESPSQTNDTWMQWGTNKIKATMPRGIASALFAVMGDPDSMDEQGNLRKSSIADEDPNGEENSDDEGGNEENGRVLVQDCVDVICEEDNGLLSLEGIFRISPSKALLRSTKASYLKGLRPELRQLCKRDPHLPAALLKDYIRSLRPPMFPESMYEMISECPMELESSIEYIRQELLPKLQPNRLFLLQQTFHCVHKVAQHCADNRMDSSNLTVVLTPNLIHGDDIMQDIALCSVGKTEKGEATTLEKKGSGTLGGIVKICIENYDEIFYKKEEENTS